MTTLDVNAYALHDPRDHRGVGRWSASALIIAAIHVGLVALAIAWYTRMQPPGASSPAILIDMSPASASPEPSQMDVAPGPNMQEADTPAAEAQPPPPEPEKQVVEQIAPTPPQEKPEVVAPTEAKPEPTPLEAAPPEPARDIPKPTPTPVKPKPVQAETRKPSERPPAPRTSAAPKAERRAPVAASAPSGASSAAAQASYRQLLAAHLQRFKQYPAGAKSAGQQGVSMLSFTVSRSGGVLSSRIAGSSGHAALDAETMAMIRRAQPLPSFPAGVPQSSLSFTVPIRYSLGN